MSMIAPALYDDASEPAFRPLSAAQAKQLRLSQPSVSPWRVVAGQVLAGVLVSLIAWGVTGRQNVAWSAGYGALAVIIPAALFARGITGRFSSLNAGTAVAAFFVWEFVKIGVSVALIALAPRMVANLSWLAMLAGLVVTMKVYWLALLFVPKRKPLI